MHSQHCPTPLFWGEEANGADGRGVVEKKLCERLSLSSEGAESGSGLGVEGTC